jgi:ATP-dependent Clp protease adaptor protein ClpS
MAAAMNESPEELHETLELEDQQTLLIPMYHVVLLDDDDHSYDYVIEMLMNIFGHPETKAYEMACEVDRSKRVIVETTYKERAEMKRDQIHSYGVDWRIPHCKGSMSATIEPAE